MPKSKTKGVRELELSVSLWVCELQQGGHWGLGGYGKERLGEEADVEASLGQGQEEWVQRRVNRVLQDGCEGELGGQFLMAASLGAVRGVSGCLSATDCRLFPHQETWRLSSLGARQLWACLPVATIAGWHYCLFFSPPWQ